MSIKLYFLFSNDAYLKILQSLADLHNVGLVDTTVAYVQLLDRSGQSHDHIVARDPRAIRQIEFFKAVRERQAIYEKKIC